MATASTNMKARENTQMPMNNFGNSLFFVKNKKAIKNQTRINAPFIAISLIRIGAQNGLYDSVPDVVSACQDPSVNSLE